ncbi:GNAT family N-acetyltransferase [Parapedobacter sp. GCM10030251]|uniref:GNAT family N-acetyltransferase n=1 Tax=Parapedobacter sp. GCM10030251 TaxID=3273419 RepID=UPI0036220902
MKSEIQGIEIQVVKSDDLETLNQLISVFEEVFEMENFKRPSTGHLMTLLRKETFFAVVAKAGNQVVGGLTVYILDQYYSERPLAYIYDLAVLTAYQRKGIGRNLIEFTTEYGKQRGFEEVFVQADKVDEYAVQFYRSTRATEEEQVIHFYYTL